MTIRFATPSIEDLIANERHVLKKEAIHKRRLLFNDVI